MNRKVNFAIIDKNLLLVSLLIEHLEKTNLFDNILSFGEVDKFWKHLNSDNTNPDIALVKLVIEPNNGVELIQKLKQIKSPIKVIAYSSNYQLEYSGHMLISGARAYCCSKCLAPKKLLDVILDIFENGYCWTLEQLNSIAEFLPSSIPKDICPINKLTKREKEILPLLAKQKTTQEIANELHISTKTVDSHKSSALSKTGAKNAVGLAVFAIKNQLIEINDINI